MAPSVLVEHTCRQKELKNNSQEVLTAMVGKTQRVSRGYSTGFVPDYRYAVETIGESEGLGSSGRFEMDRTASDDSFALKRKCISLNVDISNGFGIPLQVISLAKMSRYEKKELEQRLKSELEQIQNLQRKLQPWFTSIASLSGLGDGRVPAEDLHRSSEFLSSGQGKKRGPPGRSGPNLKRGFSGRFQAVKRVPLSNSSDLKLMKQCEALLKRLMDHPYGWVFNSPVDTVKLNIPDYLTVIKHPMDLGTVKSKLAKKEYSSPLEFLADVRLTFSNAMTYNPPGNDVHAMADQLSKIFEMRWKSIEKKLPVNQSAPDPVQLGVSRETLAAKSVSPSKKRKTSLGSHDLKTEPVAPTMTDEEKHSLGKDIEALIGELPLHIIDLLRNQSSGANQTGEDEIEVDIDELSNDTLFTLRKLVDEFVQEKQANQKKAEPSDIEILNVSGPSNSSLPPRKGNDPVDEDVDILGNDPPVSSYAPVEIDKDTARRSSKSSSSSSSSDSGSSSSDSGSSSGSDSNHAKASSPMNVVKEVLGSGETVNHQANGLDPHDGNQAVSGVDQVEQSSQLKPPFVEVESRQEGKSAPSERQVLPDKLYRAALLRGRFADTILKAREKTLNEGEKGDPEKLRRFREDLERQQREEKNRLQAEAKAAEDARIEAAKEAAAAAKRKRELEREAARQALLQMEKTVEINENAKFLEDLEMLRSASAAVDLPYVEETSHGQSEDSMSCFNFQGSSNPLEQLGLYMRMDDDEDEEVAPDNVASENEEGVVPDREEVAPYAHRDNDEVAAENVALNQEEEGALDRVYAENDEVTANNVILDKEEAPHNVYKDNNEVAEDDVGLGKEEEGVAMDIDEVAAGNVALKREAEEPAPHNVNADNDEVAAEDVTLDKEEEEVAMAVDEVAAGNVAVEREEEAALDEVYADKVEVAAEEVAADKEEEVAPDNVYANSYKAAADDVVLDDEKEEVAKDNVNVDNDEVAMDSVYVDNEKEEDAPDNVYAVNDEDVAGDTVCLDNKEAPTNIYLDNGNIVADNVGSENQEGIAHQNVYAVNDEDVAGDSVCLDNEEAPTNIYLDNGNIVADNVGLENQEGVAHQSVYGDNDEVDDVALDNEEEVAPQNVTVANEGVDDVALDNEKKEIGLVNVYADNGDVVADNVAMDIEKRVAQSNVCADNGKVAGENVCLGNEKEDGANTDNEVAAGSDAADDDEVAVDNEEEVVLGNVYADNDEVAAENIASCNEEEGVALNNVCADNNKGAVENVGSGHEKEQGAVENVYVDTDEVAADNVALDKEEECASDSVFGDKAEVAVDDVGLEKEEEVGPSNVYEDSEEVAVANVAADKKEEVAPHDVYVDKTEVALNVVSDTPLPPQVQQDVEGGEVD